MSQKYPDPIKGYDFIIGRGGKPTYRLNRKMTGQENVPEEIKAQLLEQYEMLSAQRAEENRQAAAAEAAKEAAELANGTPPVQAVDVVDEVSFVGEEIANVQVPENVQVESTPPAANPFTPSPLENVQSIADVIPNPAPSQEMTPEEQAILDAYPTDPTVPVPQTVPLRPETPTSELEAEALKQEVERLKGMIKELLTASVFEADLNTLATQLAERFNVYTVFIGREPNHTDIHPITAEIMNNFDRGLAYKQYVRATLSGTLNNIQQAVSVAQADPRFEREVPAQVAPLPPQARTMEEQSHLNGKIKNAESYGIDGVIQDPPIFNRRPIVDESWLSKAKSIDDFDLEQL